jgi:hypothetical protein
MGTIRHARSNPGSLTFCHPIAEYHDANPTVPIVIHSAGGSPEIPGSRERETPIKFACLAGSGSGTGSCLWRDAANQTPPFSTEPAAFKGHGPWAQCKRNLPGVQFLSCGHAP